MYSFFWRSENQVWRSPAAGFLFPSHQKTTHSVVMTLPLMPFLPFLPKNTLFFLWHIQQLWGQRRRAILTACRSASIAGSGACSQDSGCVCALWWKASIDELDSSLAWDLLLSEDASEGFSCQLWLYLPPPVNVPRSWDCRAARGRIFCLSADASKLGEIQVLKVIQETVYQNE